MVTKVFTTSPSPRKSSNEEIDERHGDNTTADVKDECVDKTVVEADILLSDEDEDQNEHNADNEDNKGLSKQHSHTPQLLETEVDDHNNSIKSWHDENENITDEPQRNVLQLKCHRCKRINRESARYCDGCGGKMETSENTCPCCTTSNHVTSQFCCSCGSVLRTTLLHDDDDDDSDVADKIATVSLDSDDILSVEDEDYDNRYISKRHPNVRWKEDISTQHGGTGKSRNPSFHCSPGKGYWRQQVEHICHHLKIYAQNHVEFRDEVGDAVMSRMLDGYVESSEDKLVLTAIFSMKGGGSKDTLEHINSLSHSNGLHRSKVSSIRNAKKKKR